MREIWSADNLEGMLPNEILDALADAYNRGRDVEYERALSRQALGLPLEREG